MLRTRHNIAGERFAIFFLPADNRYCYDGKALSSRLQNATVNKCVCGGGWVCFSWGGSLGAA